VGQEIRIEYKNKVHNFIMAAEVILRSDPILSLNIYLCLELYVPIYNENY
jgi:hypothetical protein